jgi:hypothetical protein
LVPSGKLQAHFLRHIIAGVEVLCDFCIHHMNTQRPDEELAGLMSDG